ncbi:MAG: diacylglycerol kinase family protein [Phycisphaeraceae bacterium]|nr:diacylglycerol kinase family protein [Phycisphaeraceae bacterium]
MTTPPPDNSPPPRPPFTLRARLRSFAHAFAGLRDLLLSQHNARIHAAATLAVVIAGLLVQLTRYEWCWIVLAIVAVWTAEALNTALERLADAACPQQHPLIKQSKDLAAAAVLITALGAIALAALIFIPHLL